MDDIVLVCIVPRIRDWEILEREHWYHIPIESAPEIVKDAKFLAFYQPMVFGEEKWRVNYYAPVLGYTVKKRIELFPFETGHKNRDRDYYQIFVGEIIRLKNPIISARYRRIVFIPTTLNKLLGAIEINDLYNSSPIEEILYEGMKKEGISPERQLYVREEGKNYCLDFGIFYKDGRIDVECNGREFHSGEEAHKKDRHRNNELTSRGWSILRFSGSEINKEPKRCIRKIKKTVKSLGGEV